MTDGTGERTRYLVELAAPEAGWDDIERMLKRARGAAPTDGGARFIRSIFVPEDGRCYLLYEADSENDARIAATHAELAVAGVVEALRTHEEDGP